MTQGSSGSALCEAADAQTIGECVKRRRRESGMTQEVAAALCGVSKKTLIKIEKGGDVYFSTLLQVTHSLGIELHIITKGSPVERAGQGGEDDDWF